MNIEFEKVQEELGLMQVSIMAVHEHVGEIENGIQANKERSRSVVPYLPFKLLQKQIVMHLVYFCAMLLNTMPAEQGILSKYSPREIVIKQEMDSNKDCKAIFGL